MDDFFQQQSVWLNTWQEQQQKLAKQYAEWGENLAKDFTGTIKAQIPANFEDLLKTQQELFEQFSRFGVELQRNIQQAWGDKLPVNLLRQFNFNLLQEFYKSWLGSMKFPGGLQNPFTGGQNWADPSSFLKNFMNHEHPFFSAFSNSNLADEMQKMFGIFGMLQGSRLPGGDIYSQMFTNFQGMFNQLASTGASQGFDQLLESFTNWKEQADKYLLAPQVGIYRETAQDISRLTSLSLDYVRSFASMSKLMEETARKAGNRFQAKLVERSLNGEPPLKFSDFCSLWTQENEAVFLEVFGSQGFAKAQGDFAAAGFRLKIQLTELAEKVLDQTPVALKRDIDLVAREIVQLKRELRKSRKQQQELAAEAKAARDALAASEQRFQKLETAMAKVQALAETADKAARSTDTASDKRLQKLEATLAKTQALAETADKAARSTDTASEKRLQKLEAALAKTQAPAAADKAAKPKVARQSAAAPETTATATRKKTAATTQKAATSRSAKSAGRAKKSVDTSIE